MFLAFVSTIFFAYLASQKNQKKSICSTVSLDIHTINKKRVLCVFPDNSKVQFILKNNGTATIKEADIILKGSKGEAAKKLESLMLKKGSISTHVVDFGKGELEKIEIIPYALENHSGHYCKSKKITITDIPTC